MRPNVDVLLQTIALIVNFSKCFKRIPTYKPFSRSEKLQYGNDDNYICDIFGTRSNLLFRETTTESGETKYV